VVDVGAPFDEPLAVPGASVGGHDHPGTGEVGAPAQLDVVAVERDRRIEAAERSEQVGAHEEARRREHEHVADGIVLLLVDLVGPDDRIDLAEAVELEADMLEHSRIVPVDELRADQSGVRPEHLGDHDAHGALVERDVVVADEEEAVVALHQAQHLVDRGPEADVGAELTHERVGKHTVDAGPHLVDRIGCVVRVIRRGDEEQGAQVGVVLRGERCERFVEPVARVVHHHHGHDRGHELLVGVHDGARLAGGAGTSPSPVSARGDRSHTGEFPSACFCKHCWIPLQSQRTRITCRPPDRRTQKGSEP
jgi:hypothetical protein